MVRPGKGPARQRRRGRFAMTSRKERSAKRWASSDRICKCSSVACSGTSRTNSRFTGDRPANRTAPAWPADEGAGRLLQALDAAVGNGDALTETGRAEFFPGEEAIEYHGAGEAEMPFKELAGLLEYPFLAARIQIEKNLRGVRIWLSGFMGVQKTKAATRYCRGRSAVIRRRGGHALPPRWWSWTFCLYFRT
jgi:hypothetical protein